MWVYGAADSLIATTPLTGGYDPAGNWAKGITNMLICLIVVVPFAISGASIGLRVTTLMIVRHVPVAGPLVE
jgi:hypothetical protein